MANDGTNEREDKRLSERTCVGCRQVAEREALVRFAVRADEGVAVIVPDLGHKLGGRGASTHASRACIEAGVRRGGFAKATSARVTTEPEALVAAVVAQLEQRARGLLLGAIRSRHATLGADTTEKAITERRVIALVIASDAATRTVGVAESIARLGGKAIGLGMTKSELGALVGRDEVAVIGIGDDGIAGALAHVAEQLAGVRGGNQFDPNSGEPSSHSEVG